MSLSIRNFTSIFFFFWSVNLHWSWGRAGGRGFVFFSNHEKKGPRTHIHTHTFLMGPMERQLLMSLPKPPAPEWIREQTSKPLVPVARFATLPLEYSLPWVVTGTLFFGLCSDRDSFVTLVASLLLLPCCLGLCIEYWLNKWTLADAQQERGSQQAGIHFVMGWYGGLALLVDVLFALAAAIMATALSHSHPFLCFLVPFVGVSYRIWGVMGRVFIAAVEAEAVSWQVPPSTCLIYSSGYAAFAQARRSKPDVDVLDWSAVEELRPVSTTERRHWTLGFFDAMYSNAFLRHEMWKRMCSFNENLGSRVHELHPDALVWIASRGAEHVLSQAWAWGPRRLPLGDEAAVAAILAGHIKTTAAVLRLTTLQLTRQSLIEAIHSCTHLTANRRADLRAVVAIAPLSSRSWFH